MDYTVNGILQARILEWVAYNFSSGSSWARNPTGVSCIAGIFFTNWAIREALTENLPANAGDTRDVGLIPRLVRSTWKGNGNLLRYSCLGKSHGQRILVGYSPRGHKESDMTVHTHTHYKYIKYKLNHCDFWMFWKENRILRQIFISSKPQCKKIYPLNVKVGSQGWNLAKADNRSRTRKLNWLGLYQTSDLITIS